MKKDLNRSSCGGITKCREKCERKRGMVSDYGVKQRSGWMVKLSFGEGFSSWGARVLIAISVV